MYACIDLGGTKTLVSVFAPNKREIVKQWRFETPSHYPEFLEEVRRVSQEIKSEYKIEKGAIGTRGLLDRPNGTIVIDKKLGWHNTAIAVDLSEIFNCKFLIENDSKLAGLSEANEPDNQTRKVLYITVSTGIGSALVVNGKLDIDTINSEIGHWIFNYNGEYQQWEDFAAGSYLTRTYNKRASELDDESSWRDYCKNLAPGFINAIICFNPDVIVIGGGVGSHYHKFEQYLLDAINTIKPDIIKLCPIIQAKHPEEAVIYGCYELLNQSNND